MQCLARHPARHARGTAPAPPSAYHRPVTLAHGLDDETLDRAQEMLRTYRAGFLVDRVHVYEGDEHGVWHVRETVRFGQRGADERGSH